MKEIILIVRKLIARSNVLSFRFCIFFCCGRDACCLCFGFGVSSFCCCLHCFSNQHNEIYCFFSCPYFVSHYKCFYANLMKLKWTKVFFNKQVDEILFLRVLVITNHVAKSQGLIIIYFANNDIKVRF